MGDRYRTPADGEGGWTEWVSPVQQGSGLYKFRCCDCDLIHDMDFHVSAAGKVLFRVRRNTRATGQARRWRNAKR